jgi:hypothetical protein
MPALPRKSATKSARKVALPKLRASEILSGLHVTPSERKHAKRAVAAAKKAVAVKTRVPELRSKASELRVHDRRLRNNAKAKK